MFRESNLNIIPMCHKPIEQVIQPYDEARNAQEAFDRMVRHREVNRTVQRIRMDAIRKANGG